MPLYQVISGASHSATRNGYQGHQSLSGQGVMTPSHSQVYFSPSHTTDNYYCPYSEYAPDEYNPTRPVVDQYFVPPVEHDTEHPRNEETYLQEEDESRTPTNENNKTKTEEDHWLAEYGL